MEVSDVRRRLRGAIEDAKRRAAERRLQVDDASRAWQEKLDDTVVPAFHTMAQALAAEGQRFKVETPAGAARLSLERSAEEFVELALDTDGEEPALFARSTRGRGRRIISSERVVREGAAVAQLSQEDVVTLLLEELVPFIER